MGRIRRRCAGPGTPRPPESRASLSSREQELLRRLQQELAVREESSD
ncbi:hypothetical protein [Pseudonocardia pini]|nr:hypothetical protein [Pseudonocardia pini]